MSQTHPDAAKQQSCSKSSPASSLPRVSPLLPLLLFSQTSRCRQSFLLLSCNKPTLTQPKVCLTLTSLVFMAGCEKWEGLCVQSDSACSAALWLKRWSLSSSSLFCLFLGGGAASFCPAGCVRMYVCMYVCLQVRVCACVCV